MESVMVLLVDDDPNSLAALTSLLETRLAHLRIDTAESGVEALAAIEDVDYDAIVSDIKMPGMDGLALMQRVLERRPSTPTLLVTGHGDHSLAVKAMDAGAYAFIQKPIDRDFFIAWLKRAIQLRHLSRAVEQQNRRLEEAVQARTRQLAETNDMLRRTQQQLLEATEAAQCGMWDWDLRTGTLEWFGLHRWVGTLLVGTVSDAAQHGIDLLDPQERHRISSKVRTLMEARERHYADEYRCVDEKGRHCCLSATGLILFDAHGHPIRMTGVVQDITERKIVEDALRLSEERYRATFDTAAVGIAHVGLDGRWLRFNDRLCAITGYSRAELLTKTFADITHPDDLEQDWRLAQQLIAGGIETYTMEKRYVRPDRSRVWVNLTVSMLRDGQGHPLNFISVIEDITARKLQEEALEERARLATLRAELNSAFGTGMDLQRSLQRCADLLVQHLSLAAARIWTLRGDLLEVQATAGSAPDLTTGASPAILASSDLAQLVAEQCVMERSDRDLGEVDEARAESALVRAGYPLMVETTVVGAVEVWASERLAAPVVSELDLLSDEMAQVIQRKRVEDALRESEATALQHLQRLQTLTDSIEGIVWEVDPQTFRFTFISQQAERLLGHPIQRWMSEEGFWVQHLHPDDREWAVDFCRRATEEHRDHEFEYRFLAADGRVVWLHDVATVIVQDGKVVALRGVMVDITKRKEGAPVSAAPPGAAGQRIAR